MESPGLPSGSGLSRICGTLYNPVSQRCRIQWPRVASHKDDWEPPSQSEMKVIQARRERQDKISKLMGGYLLKGYRMLGECCEECSTILMQDKQKKNYCVACQELDSDMDKDNPVCSPHPELSLCLWFQTILMQDKQKKNYCVACQELDSDMDKDNPGHLSSAFVFADESLSVISLGNDRKDAVDLDGECTAGELMESFW
ncbi:UNVERIFIED_CONTAM: hypothetical protein FKN15_005905 [Acipenser sinensis]